MILPLTHWQLRAKELPCDSADEAQEHAFSLPGADALAAFADLIGGSEEADDPSENAGMPFTLPAMIGEEITGEVCLSREIDFGALCGDRAILTLDHITGSGEILVGERTAARFGGHLREDLLFADNTTAVPCRLTVDLTDALNLGRRQTLTIRFSDMRPAGICGPVCLHASPHAHLCHASVTPDSLRRTMNLSITVCAQQAGRYALRVHVLLPDAPAEAARESIYSFGQNETRDIQLAFNAPADAFVPGKAYAAPVLKIQLFFLPGRTTGEGCLCDNALLACGYGARRMQAWLPLSGSALCGDPDVLCRRLLDLGIFSVALPGPAPDCTLRALRRAGIATIVHVPADDPLRASLTRHANLFLSDDPVSAPDVSLAQSAWQLCSSVSFPRAIDGTLMPAELLYDASGLEINPSDTEDILLWLRAVLIRLRAEAARQERYQGALCAPDEPEQPDVRDALRTAFAPVHLSALPLAGAWWTGTRFSASLCAFVPDDLCANEAIQAIAVLEDESGAQLACFSASCMKSGHIGMIEASLPDSPCVLTLHTSLLRLGRVIEESTIPVYVGERGPLEAAFI